MSLGLNGDYGDLLGTTSSYGFLGSTLGMPPLTSPNSTNPPHLTPNSIPTSLPNGQTIQTNQDTTNNGLHSPNTHQTFGLEPFYAQNPYSIPPIGSINTGLGGHMTQTNMLNDPAGHMNSNSPFGTTTLLGTDYLNQGLMMGGIGSIMGLDHSLGLSTLQPVSTTLNNTNNNTTQPPPGLELTNTPHTSNNNINPLPIVSHNSLDVTTSNNNENNHSKITPLDNMNANPSQKTTISPQLHHQPSPQQSAKSFSSNTSTQFPPVSTSTPTNGNFTPNSIVGLPQQQHISPLQTLDTTIYPPQQQQHQHITSICTNTTTVTNDLSVQTSDQTITHSHPSSPTLEQANLGSSLTPPLQLSLSKLGDEVITQGQQTTQLTLTRQRIELDLLRAIISPEIGTISKYLNSLMPYIGSQFPTSNNTTQNNNNNNTDKPSTPTSTTTTSSTTTNTVSSESTTTTATNTTKGGVLTEQDDSNNNNNNNDKNTTNTTNSTTTNNNTNNDNTNPLDTFQYQILLNSPINIPYELRTHLPTLFSTPYIELINPQVEDEQQFNILTPHVSRQKKTFQPLFLTPIAFLILSFIPQLPPFLPINQHLRQVIPHIVEVAIPKAMELIRYGARVDSTTFTTHCQVIQYAILSLTQMSSSYIQQQSLYTSDNSTTGGVSNPFAPPPFSSYTTSGLLFDTAPQTQTPPTSTSSPPPPGLSLPTDNTSSLVTSSLQNQQLISFFGVRMQPTMTHCTWLLFMCTELLQMNIVSHYDAIIHTLHHQIQQLTHQLHVAGKYAQWNHNGDRANGHGNENGNVDVPKLTFSQGAKPFIPSTLQNSNVDASHYPHKPKPILSNAAFPSLGGSKKDKIKNSEEVKANTNTTTNSTTNTANIPTGTNSTTLSATNSNNTTTTATKQTGAKDEKTTEKVSRGKEKKNDAKALKKLKSQGTIESTTVQTGSTSPQTVPAVNGAGNNNNTINNNGKKDTKSGKKAQTFNIDEFHRITSPPGDTTPLATSIRPQPPTWATQGSYHQTASHGHTSWGQNYSTQQSTTFRSNFHNNNNNNNNNTTTSSNNDKPLLRTNAQPFMPLPSSSSTTTQQSAGNNGILGVNQVNQTNTIGSNLRSNNVQSVPTNAQSQPPQSSFQPQLHYMMPPHNNHMTIPQPLSHMMMMPSSSHQVYGHNNIYNNYVPTTIQSQDMCEHGGVGGVGGEDDDNDEDDGELDEFYDEYEYLDYDEDEDDHHHDEEDGEYDDIDTNIISSRGGPMGTNHNGHVHFSNHHHMIHQHYPQQQQLHQQPGHIGVPYYGQQQPLHHNGYYGQPPPGLGLPHQQQQQQQQPPHTATHPSNTTQSTSHTSDEYRRRVGYTSQLFIPPSKQ